MHLQYSFLVGQVDNHCQLAVVILDLSPSHKRNQEKAMNEYTTVVEAFGGEVEKDLVSNYEQALVESSTTKCSGVLFALFKNKGNIAELRPLVQKEIKNLRSLGLTEQAALHPTLLGKVKGTLAMKA
eukprot:6468159-Amphidinium_carterae.3